jgi:cold shock CspA family protein
MGRSQETYHKKEVRKSKENKIKEKEQKRSARKEKSKSSSLDDMIAYVDEEGMITSAPPFPGRKRKIKADGIEISVPRKNPDEGTMPLRKGKVTLFNESKGFGFIKDSETQEKVFVHVNDVGEEINEGSFVSFEIMKGRKGPTAVQVKLLA